MARAPFRIQKLEIRDFRGIDHLELEFALLDDEGAMTVIAGDNGAGKTSVLEAIALGLGRSELVSAVPLDQQVRLGARQFLVDITTDRSVPWFAGHLKRFEYVHPEVTQVSDAKGRVTIIDNKGHRDAVRSVQPRVEYFSAQRAPDPSNASKQSQRIADLKRKLTNVFLRSARGGNGGLRAEHSPFARIEGFVRTFLGGDVSLDVFPASNDPSSEHEVVVRRGEIPADVTSLAMARLLAPDRKDIPEILLLDQLSSGQLALFAFAGPLVFRDEPADVVLLDEPEQHLHMLWQRVILGALRGLSPTSHFIVATQSRDILDSVLHAERVYLVADDDPRAASATQTAGDEAHS